MAAFPSPNRDQLKEALQSGGASDFDAKKGKLSISAYINMLFMSPSLSAENPASGLLPDPNMQPQWTHCHEGSFQHQRSGTFFWQHQTQSLCEWPYWSWSIQDSSIGSADTLASQTLGHWIVFQPQYHPEKTLCWQQFQTWATIHTLYPNRWVKPALLWSKHFILGKSTPEVDVRFHWSRY